MLELQRLYPITDASLSGLSHAEQVEQFARGGSRLVQLREKTALSDRFYLEAMAAADIARSNGVRLIINDRVDIAMAVGADGVHLGQDDLPPDEARKLLGAKALIGYSTHNLSQAEAAIEFPVDYIAIGPVFRTSTKEDAEPVVGLTGVREVKQMIGKLPLVAIGGITLDNYASVLEAGADSVAVIGALFSHSGGVTKAVSSFLA